MRAKVDLFLNKWSDLGSAAQKQLQGPGEVENRPRRTTPEKGPEDGKDKYGEIPPHDWEIVETEPLMLRVSQVTPMISGRRARVRAMRGGRTRGTWLVANVRQNCAEKRIFFMVRRLDWMERSLSVNGGRSRSQVQGVARYPR